LKWVLTTDISFEGQNHRYHHCHHQQLSEAGKRLSDASVPTATIVSLHSALGFYSTRSGSNYLFLGRPGQHFQCCWAQATDADINLISVSLVNNNIINEPGYEA